MTPLGTFTRQGRKSDETVRSALVELAEGDANDDAAKRVESVLRAMLVASGLGGSETKTWGEDG